MSASASPVIDPERLQSTAERGEEIYAEHKDALEKEHWGQMVAVDVNTGEIYVVDDSYEELLKAAQDTDGYTFHLIRVGFPSAYDVGHIDDPTLASEHS